MSPVHSDCAVGPAPRLQLRFTKSAWPHCQSAVVSDAKGSLYFRTLLLKLSTMYRLWAVSATIWPPVGPSMGLGWLGYGTRHRLAADAATAFVLSPLQVA